MEGLPGILITALRPVEATPTALDLSAWNYKCQLGPCPHPALTYSSLEDIQSDPAVHTEKEQGLYFHVRAKTTDLEYSKDRKA